ncbi:hypothetical protein Tsubulata_042569 [Turnera subulata]|uniref:DUF4283 domain-containing protein n=1 Tax=Turnera subulata TaxID=218843 RepID=A0A9Q0GBJ1_9ROSI|nr:hypothetical protein Tsubulata_042569 [Turnera subulata]
MLLASLNSVAVDDGALKASRARNRMSHCNSTSQTTRVFKSATAPAAQNKSYATTVRETPPAPISKDPNKFNWKLSLNFTPSNSSLEWLSSCIFGVLAVPLERHDLIRVFHTYRVQNVDFCDMGGDSWLFHFPSNEAKDEFLAQEFDWIHESFQLFRAWKLEDCATNRKCWLQFRGVPIQAWSSEFFHHLVSRFGDVLKLAEVSEKKMRLDVAFVQVLTTVKKSIQWEFKVIMNGKNYEIEAIEIPESHVPVIIPTGNCDVFGDLISMDHVDVQTNNPRIVHGRMQSLLDSPAPSGGFRPVLIEEYY